MTRLVLIGGGGHARSCIDAIGSTGGIEIVGILERPRFVGTRVLGIPVIGTDEEIPALVKDGMAFLIAVGQIETPEPRQRLFSRLKGLGARLPAIVAPTAHVSPHAWVGEGSIVMNMAVVGPLANIGANCIVNSRALVEHDVEVGDHCHISTGALINGSCRIGNGVFVGSGAVVRDGVSIGEGTFIPMGTLVTRDVPTAERGDAQGDA
jgi:sugar O-acyltransferase (sialic acid O-acetyltransferase NeuD family)